MGIATWEVGANSAAAAAAAADGVRGEAAVMRAGVSMLVPNTWRMTSRSVAKAWSDHRNKVFARITNRLHARFLAWKPAY